MDLDGTGTVSPVSTMLSKPTIAVHRWWKETPIHGCRVMVDCGSALHR
ncbi:hypothetical protein [Kitasatospora arboriphila]